MDECIFCKILGGEIPPGKGKIFENDNFIAVLDINPLVEGHTVLFSKKHFKNILEMPSTLGQEFLDCVKETSLIVMKKFNAKGFNLHVNTFEVAGQLVKHFHIHILPRKTDDGFKPCA